MILSPSDRGAGGSGLEGEMLGQRLPSLEDFKLEEHLACGYTRYQAIHSESALPVWVHHFAAIDASCLEALDERLERAKQLQLEEFVRPLGHVHHNGDLLLVTDVVAGVRLDQLLHQVDPDQARRWASDLSGALRSLHEAGEIHGRLCPQAIYITPNGPRIFGVGLSDLWEPVWNAMDQDGKMPPRLFTSLEVRLDGVAEASPSADIFSLGTILYRGYTGVFPGEFCPLPSDKADVPRSVDGAVMIAMHPDGESRQQTMDEFIDEFTGVRVRGDGQWSPRSLADDLSGGPQKPHWLDGTGTWIRHLRWVAAALVLALVGWKTSTVLKEDKPPEVREEIAGLDRVKLKRKEEVKKPVSKVVGTDIAERLAKLISYADLAAGQHDWFLEREALQLACRLAPDDGVLQARLDVNPWQVRSQIREAIDLLKLANPRQENWRIVADFEPGGCRLDLSGNRHLIHIPALLEQRFISLDLSGTSVNDLSPLLEYPPRELRANDMPLSDFSDFNPMTTVVTSNGEKPRPVLGQGFENSLGMRFEPILEKAVLVSRYETTYRQFETFAGGVEIPPNSEDMQSWSKDGWQRLGHQWHAPGFETGPDHPVVGVTREDAERFCDWLTNLGREQGELTKEQFYRLPSDYEWGTAAGIEEHALLTPARREEISGRGRKFEPLRIVEGIEIAEADKARPAEVWEGLPVGQFYGILGNVSEWCDGDGDGGSQMVRGGASGARVFHPFGTCRQDIGFRVVLDLGVPAEQGLGELIAGGDWDDGREAAIGDAFNQRNRHAREAGRAFLEARERAVSDEKRVREDPILTKEHNGRRYQLVRLPLNWGQARRFAADSGGRLAGRDDPALLRWLAQLDGEEPISMWLGARHKSTGWLWENGDGAKELELPKPGMERQRLVMTAANELVAAESREPHSFVIEWDRVSEEQVVARGD